MRQARYVVKSVGRKFARIRALAGRHFTSVVGDEIKIKKAPFRVVRVERKGRELLLEGIQE